MANRVHLPKKSKVRCHKQKNPEENVAVNSAKYLYDFTIAISFTNGKTKPVDFFPLFHKYVRSENLVYFSPGKFKKFIVKNGNIYWAKMKM